MGRSIHKITCFQGLSNLLPICHSNLSLSPLAWIGNSDKISLGKYNLDSLYYLGACLDTKWTAQEIIEWFLILINFTSF